VVNTNLRYVFEMVLDCFLLKHTKVMDPTKYFCGLPGSMDPRLGTIGLEKQA